MVFVKYKPHYISSSQALMEDLFQRLQAFFDCANPSGITFASSNACFNNKKKTP